MAEVMETALELEISELLKTVVAQTRKTSRFKTLLKRLENTLISIDQVFFESWRLSKVLNRPEKETRMFVFYLKKGKELVLKCSRINYWNVNQKRLHSNKLIRLNNELLRFFQIELQAKMTSTRTASLIEIYDLADRMDQVLSTVTTSVRPSSNFYNVPGLPELIVSFDLHLQELKHRLLNSDKTTLAKLLCIQETIAERKRVFMEIHDNGLGIQQIAQPINTRILSISTDELLCLNWDDLKALKVEVLTLNIRSKNYSLPELIGRMSQLKDLSITGYGGYPSQLHNLSLIGSLSNLERIRFQHVSVSSIEPIFALKNLRKLSFIMCEIGNAFMNCTTEPSYMLPNLTDLEIDQCYDLKELPSGLCDLVHLQKLSITNCHELDVLPQGLGGLSNLEIFRLHSCTKLQELPESIGSLHNLSFIDISDCLSISVLPEEIGELRGLRVLKMSGCRGLQELPISMSKLLQLEEVICDEETSYLWMDFESDLYNLKINVVEDDRFESFMKIIQ